MKTEDIQLVIDAQNDPAAYDALYKKYFEKIYNYFLYRVYFHKQVAEDLTQDTFIKAYNALDRFTVQDASYYTYLLSIAHNVLIDFYRKENNLSQDQSEIESVKDDIINMDNKIDVDLLLEELNELSLSQKTAILLFYRKDMAIADIAIVMNKNENSVRLLLTQGRKKIREKYLQQLNHLEDVSVDSIPEVSLS